MNSNCLYYCTYCKLVIFPAENKNIPLMFKLMKMILLLTIFLHIMYEQLYEYIFNVHFELIPLGQRLFVCHKARRRFLFSF